MPGPLFYFSGIDGLTGQPLISAQTPGQVAAIARQSRIEEKKPTRRGPGSLVDERELAQTGWGVLFAQEDETALAVRNALRPLLEHRKSSVASGGGLYREYLGPMGFREKDTKLRWLARHGMGPGTVDPKRVPYYLLIVGSPELIPYEFQYQLDVQYAVGRIHFSSLEDYACYAQSVVSAETSPPVWPRKAVFFAPEHGDDPATEICNAQLVEPLMEALEPFSGDWELSKVVQQAATKDRLRRLLGGDETPALLFTAGHGTGFRNGCPMQLERQGQLVCADWPNHNAPFSQDYCFSGVDLSDDANVHGLIAFCFACFSAGTPTRDNYTWGAGAEARSLAPFDFVARLPQRLLAHPNGGALAFIGHVEKAWEFSYYLQEAGSQIETFKSTFEELLRGFPVGAALKYINYRYAELASDLRSELNGERDDGEDLLLSRLWISTNDCRNYAVVGDPAVRLQL